MWAGQKRGQGRAIVGPWSGGRMSDPSAPEVGRERSGVRADRFPARNYRSAPPGPPTKPPIGKGQPNTYCARPRKSGSHPPPILSRRVNRYSGGWQRRKWCVPDHFGRRHICSRAAPYPSQGPTPQAAPHLCADLSKEVLGGVRSSRRHPNQIGTLFVTIGTLRSAQGMRAHGTHQQLT
jgi:hypothetical protein